MLGIFVGVRTVASRCVKDMNREELGHQVYDGAKLVDGPKARWTLNLELEDVLESVERRESE